MLSLMCEKFHNHRLRNHRALGNGKSEDNTNTKNKNNVGATWRPVSGSKKCALAGESLSFFVNDTIYQSYLTSELQLLQVEVL